LGFGQTLFNLAARQLHGEIHNAWSGTVLTVTLLLKWIRRTAEIRERSSP